MHGVHKSKMKPLKWNVAEVKAQIGQLLLAYPELAEDEILRADMLEGETDLHAVLRELEQTRQTAATTETALKLYVEELRSRASRFERREQAMRALIFQLMQAAELLKVELPEATLSIRSGTAKTIITDEDRLPNEFVRIKREPDKIKIKAALSNGQTVPGATLSNVEPVLSIRTK